MYSLIFVCLSLASVSLQTIEVTATSDVIAGSTSLRPEVLYGVPVPIDFVNQTAPWKLNLTDYTIDRQPVIIELQVTENQAHIAIFKFRILHAEGRNFHVTVQGQAGIKKADGSQYILRNINDILNYRRSTSKVYPILEMATILNKANGWLSYDPSFGKDVINLTWYFSED